MALYRALENITKNVSIYTDDVYGIITSHRINAIPAGTAQRNIFTGEYIEFNPENTTKDIKPFGIKHDILLKKT
jgi:hypothetical protein